MCLSRTTHWHPSDTPVAVTSDSDEIKAVFHSYQECLNHGSTDEALALYASDVSQNKDVPSYLDQQVAEPRCLLRLTRSNGDLVQSVNHETDHGCVIGGDHATKHAVFRRNVRD